MSINDHREQLAETLDVDADAVEQTINPSAKTNHDFMFWKVDYHDGVLGYFPGTVLPDEYIEGQAMTSSLSEQQRVFSARQTGTQKVNPGEV